MVPRPTSNRGDQGDHLDDPSNRTWSALHQELHSHTSEARPSASKELDLPLNEASTNESPIDPSLTSTATSQHHAQLNGTLAVQKDTSGGVEDGTAESERKVAHLLRHFSDSPGQWYAE